MRNGVSSSESSNSSRSSSSFSKTTNRRLDFGRRDRDLVAFAVFLRFSCLALAGHPFFAFLESALQSLTDIGSFLHRIVTCLFALDSSFGVYIPTIVGSLKLGNPFYP